MKTLFDSDIKLEEAEELIRNGADVNGIDSLLRTPLFFVKDVEIAQLLIDHGADLNMFDYIGITPIYLCDTIELMELFIKNGARIDLIDKNNSTLLDYNYRLDTVKYLINQGVVFGTIHTFKKRHYYLSKEQQEAFNAFASITSNDNDFYQMCLAYQEGIKNNVKMDIKNMDII
jgi:ankyrin repeat protein